jgi:hypothetical protein
MGQYWSVEECCWLEAPSPPPEPVTDEAPEPSEDLQEALS